MKHKISEYQHIIWDWNGTLLNDVWLCVEVINKMLAERKIQTITAEQYRQIFDFPVRNYYGKIGFDFSKEDFNVVGLEFIFGYNERQFDCELQKDAKKLIDLFSAKGVKQSILSAREVEVLKQNLEHFNLSNYFAKIAGLDDHYANGKAEAGEKLIDELNSEYQKILFIGDTIHDVEVAEKTGHDCILMAHGHQTEERLKTTGKTVFRNFEQVINQIIDV